MTRACAGLGAKRQFYNTQVTPPPRNWEEPDVQARLGELEAGIHFGVTQTSTEEDPAAEIELEPVNRELAQIYSDVDLAPDADDAGHADWIRTEARVIRSRRELDDVKQKLRDKTAWAGELREPLFRFLSRHGEAPADGRADSETLEAGLQRLAASVNSRHSS